MKLTTHTRVRVTVEVSAGTYQTDCTTIGQIIDQASREATALVVNAIQERRAGAHAVAIGDPVVLMVTATSEPKDR